MSSIIEIYEELDDDRLGFYWCLLKLISYWTICTNHICIFFFWMNENRLNWKNNFNFLWKFFEWIFETISFVIQIHDLVTSFKNECDFITDSSSSKIEKWSPSSNVYDDLRGVDSLSSPKVPSRSTSTICYISPRETEISHIKR